MDFAIDLYVSTVDGSDEVYLSCMEDRIVEEGWVHDEQSTGRRRINDYGETRLLLDSIEYNLPWIRHIHLCVHDGQTPPWVNDTAFFRDRIKVHQHSEYFDPAIRLPTFNSFAIDTQVANVPGLAEHFIFTENDMFFPKPITPDRFFTPQGSPRLNCTLKSDDFLKGGLVWQETYLNENRLCAASFGPISQDSSLLPEIDHGPMPCRKRVLDQAKEHFGDALRVTAAHSFRHRDDVSFYLYRLMHLYSGSFSPATTRNAVYPVTNFRADIGAFVKYDSVCLNDNFEEHFGQVFIDEVSAKIETLRQSLKRRHQGNANHS